MPPLDQAQTFRRRILKTYFIRFHMGLVLTAVVASGVLGSRLLLYAGVRSMGLRYAIAVILSYAVFLLMVRIWIWWVTSAKLALDARLIDAAGSPSSSAKDGVTFSGGSSGGGGASSSWETPRPLAASSTPPPASSSNAGGWMSHLGDIDGDGWWLLLLLAILILSIFCAAGYLIYVAPQLLPEAAWQAALAGGLRGMTRRKPQPDWMTGVMRASTLPFVAVLAFAILLGWQAQLHCPTASRLVEVWDCPTEGSAR